MIDILQKRVCLFWYNLTYIYIICLPHWTLYFLICQNIIKRKFSGNSYNWKLVEIISRWWRSTEKIPNFILEHTFNVAIIERQLKNVRGWHLLESHWRGSRGHDRMVVGFTTTCAISAYHHLSCEFEPRSWRGVVDTTLCDKVCQWVATGLVSPRMLRFPPPIKLTTI